MLTMNDTTSLQELLPHERQYIIRKLVTDINVKAQLGNVAVDTLLDTLIALHDDCSNWKADKYSTVTEFLRQCEYSIVLV
jgi:hypothetical protein